MVFLFNVKSFPGSFNIKKEMLLCVLIMLTCLCKRVRNKRNVEVDINRIICLSIKGEGKTNSYLIKL